MAKRPMMDVDEEHLKEIMAGGLGRVKKEPTKPPQELPLEPSDSEQPQKEFSVKETKSIRKKREAHDYESLFLERKASVDRRQTYIGADLFKKISSFLPVISGQQLSITAYINNILTHHLEQHKEDINELYERKSQKPF